ncbi:SAV_915 family protein [Antrihabitans cavernicola]|uniref:SseB protein N-terminal domain-containing protein n=1 Tax=Antrihabitans cavernicola TaxID=2495913 RepID=A0A5A7S7M9_9NOCA|nr:SAV_915 family protein [Spelaeibacter cavernicola]KAA0021152.1 hypothetical protein FOY51_19740 [Spelaeibacter cavernicola]
MSDPMGRPNRTENPNPPVAKQVTELGVSLPPVVVVPAHPVPLAGIDIEMAKLESGEPIAVVYSTVEKLVAHRGTFQPWIALPSNGLLKLVAAKQVSGVVLDPPFSMTVPRWSAQRVRLLTEVLDGRL